MDREQPYLSIVVTSRNDGHGGSPLSRTQTFLDSLSDQCRRHSLAAELIFVEWNPPADRPRLCHALREPAQPSPLDVRFIEVPAEIHSELANHDKLGLFQMIAKNVGIRRSRGEFVLATNIDILFSEELVAFIARRELDGDFFYVAQRHDLGVYDIPDGLRGEELMEFARRNVVRVSYQLRTLPADEPPLEDREGYLNTNACGDFTMMGREAWGRFGGYAEFQLYSIHIDSLGLLSARAAGLKQCALTPPLNTFHIEHGSGWATDSSAIVATKPSLDYSCDCQPYFYLTTKNGVAPAWNDPDWGYDGVNFRECGFSGGYNVPVPGEVDRARERYGRRDDLAHLERLAAGHAPEAVVAFGCTRAALAALAAGAGNAPLFRFGNDIATMVFPEEFDGRRMFVLIDAAALADDEIGNLLDRVLPRLADGSLVLFDNVWHSPRNLLTAEFAGTFFRERVLPCLGAPRSARLRFAPHHEGGSLAGFSGIGAIADYLDSNAIRPCLSSRRKGIWFVVDHAAEKTKWPTDDPWLFVNTLRGLKHLIADRGEFLYDAVGSGAERRDGLTIFTTAKPFTGHAGAIQRVAMKSWAALSPRPEILLFGDEEGSREFAAEIGARHIPHVRRDEYGVPLVNDIFMRAQGESTTRMLAYVNADTILFDDFVGTARRIADRFPAALGVGQRWEIPAPGENVFADAGWRENLRRHARTDGFFEGCFSADYFIFTPGVWPDIPPFALGRMYWDNWLIIDARERGIPVVDASDAVFAIHQSHDYGHVPGGRHEAWHSVSSERNRTLFGRDNVRNNMAVANWLLDADGNFTESPAPRRPDPEDNKLRRYAWLMRQSRILLDEGRMDAVRGMIEELRVRTFSDRAAIDRRVAEYERALASREGK